MKVLLLCIFVGIMLFSGFTAMRRAHTVNDFFLGGRSMGPWLSAFAYGTTYFSAVIFIGYAGKVGWGFGLAALWIVLGNTLLGSFLAWLVLAKRTRAMTARLNAMTMPAFLEARYGSRNLKIFSALVIFIFLVPYSASVYMGLSYLFNQIFGIPYLFAALLMCLLTAVYLVMGGYRAVALTDFIQGLIMIAGVFVLLYFVIGAPQVGGLVQGLHRLAAVNPGLVSPAGPGNHWLPLASLVVLTSLGAWGLPQMVQKFYAIKDERAIRPAMLVSTAFALVITFGAYFSGSLTRLFFDKLPLDPSINKPTPDMLMPTLLHNILPELAAVIILLLVLSASMSTLASLVLVSSSALSIDLFEAVRPQSARRNGVFALRLFCVLFVGLSLLLALAKPAIILSLMAMSWGTVAGFFLAPYLYGLFWRGATAAGAWAGALTGLIVSVVLSLYYHLDAGVIPLVGSLSMLIPLAVLPAVSVCTPALPGEIIRRAFGRGAISPGQVILPKVKEVETT
ncbi:sodium:solute symporter family protein [Desulfotomaculum copahuensis]|uniref:Sodium:solute symporter n=1 Tax=Desulfotomaculum copahuensis TaxID=1838280 RepID=A0A1B7LB50_9FIRM|nr:sodium:solute symporter [Desulfotomaculum copahuensis]